MPLYEFYCHECRRTDETLAKMDETVSCPICQKTMQRQLCYPRNIRVMAIKGKYTDYIEKAALKKESKKP